MRVGERMRTFRMMNMVCRGRSVTLRVKREQSLKYVWGYKVGQLEE